ncbi:peptidase S8/S53 domain-containing protein [Chlamydoabsidia padenii]|nr:peptidase S8/S53 domain-containing protein [Chlamydoabsidia padenii]
MKKSDIQSSTESHPSQWQLEPIKVGNDFMAMTGVFHDIHFLDYLSGENGVVDYVEPNQYYQADVVLPRRQVMVDEANVKIAQASNWGLARISHRTNEDLNSYSYYEKDGQGVDVYVLDSGINIEHMDFEGRASTEASFVSDEADDDFGGHGTHVAGKIGGREYGVAKGVKLHAVKILDKSGVGTTSGLIRAISHVIEVATPGKSLINLSLSGPKSKILNEILKEATEGHNIPVIVSAGNAGTDACRFSPSSSKHVFAVGATDAHDRVPNYSDIGECVSIYAPGSNIKSTWIGSKQATQILDGTSMSSPHISGIAAILMSHHSYESVYDLYNAIRSLGTSGILTFDPSTLVDVNNRNLLAYYGIS